MVYTTRSAALLVIGLIILLWGWLNQSGNVDGVQAYFHPGVVKAHKSALDKHAGDTNAAAQKAKAEGKAAPVAAPMKPSRFDELKAGQVKLSYIFGGLFAVIGLLTLALPMKEGNLDYYLAAVPGIAFILLIAFVVRWVLESPP